MALPWLVYQCLTDYFRPGSGIKKPHWAFLSGRLIFQRKLDNGMLALRIFQFWVYQLREETCRGSILPVVGLVRNNSCLAELWRNDTRSGS